MTPMRHSGPLTAERNDDTLILNGEVVNLATCGPDTSPWIVDTPQKIEGEWHVLLVVPHAADAPEETLYPEPFRVSGNGALPLPPYSNG
jgi:hypothetical protein